MKVSHGILFSFLVVIVFFSAACFMNFRVAESSLKNARDLNRQIDIVRLSERFQRNFLSMVGDLRGYLNTGERSFIQGYDSAKSKNQEILAELKASFPTGSEERIVIDDIRELEKYWVDEFAEPLREAKWRITNIAAPEDEFRPFYRQKQNRRLEEDVERSLKGKFRELTRETKSGDSSSLTTRGLSAEKLSEISLYLMIAAGLIGIVSVCFLTLYINKRLGKATEMVYALASGNYEQRLPVAGRNELGRLFQGLNKMASNVQVSFESLRNQRENMDQFAYTISHDLKLPLRGIDNVVAWVKEDTATKLTAESKGYLEMIRAKVKRAENILNAIFIYMRAGSDGLIKEMVSVQELLEEIREDIVFEKSIRLVIEPGLPVLYTERVPLLQVFTNLIANSFDHHNKKDGYVKIYHRREGNLFRFFVEDNGPGIAAWQHQKIFRAFETLKGGDVSDHLGIGLAVVRKILDNKGMQIHFSSLPGEGTVFSFTWPQNEV